MQNLKTILRKKLKSAERIAILGVGSDLRGDDAAGELVVRQLQSRRKNIRTKPEVKFFFGSTAPENLTGEIKRFKPTHIIIIDSADLGKKPGTIKLLDPRDIGGVSFSTHSLPTKVLVDYLVHSLDCKVLVFAIQPQSLVFGKSVSKEVSVSIGELAAAIQSAVS